MLKKNYLKGGLLSALCLRKNMMKNSIKKQSNLFMIFSRIQENLEDLFSMFSSNTFEQDSFDSSFESYMQSKDSETIKIAQELQQSAKKLEQQEQEFTNGRGIYASKAIPKQTKQNTSTTYIKPVMHHTPKQEHYTKIQNDRDIEI